MHFILLLLSNWDGGLRVSRQYAWLRVDHAEGTKHERLILSGRYGGNGRIPGERGWVETNTQLNKD